MGVVQQLFMCGAKVITPSQKIANSTRRNTFKTPPNRIKLHSSLDYRTPLDVEWKTQHDAP